MNACNFWQNFHNSLLMRYFLIDRGVHHHLHVNQVYKRTKFIIEREAKQTLFAFRTTSKSMLRKIYRDHAAYHRRSMVEEFVNEADLSLFKRTLIQSCALAKRMKEIFNILEDQVDDEVIQYFFSYSFFSFQFASNYFANILIVSGQRVQHCGFRQC